MGCTVNQFLGRLARSGLVSESEARALAPDRADPAADARELALALVRAGNLTRYQAAAIYQGQWQNLLIGEYSVLDQIGAGGAGIVLKAQHRRMRRIVAVKMLSPERTRSPAAVQRFMQEMKVAGQLAHPNIAAAYDAGEHRGAYYLVMEFVDGNDLESLVQRHGPLSAASAVKCVLQAAQGLAYAHAEGVIHRDIKPANLLLNRSGVVKILDMGFCRWTDVEIEAAEAAAAADLTSDGQVLGTFSYMAPEQAADTRTADERADIYSLGCTLHFLLMGRAVYEADTIVKKILAHREAPIPSLRAVRADVPEYVDRAFQKMVAKRPENRFASMQEVELALEGKADPRDLLPPESADLNVGDAELMAFLDPASGEGGPRTFLASLAGAGENDDDPRDVPPIGDDARELRRRRRPRRPLGTRRDAIVLAACAALLLVALAVFLST